MPNAPQAQGYKSKIIIANERVFKEAPQYVIEACESAWSEFVGTGVAAASTTDCKEGSYALALSLTASLVASNEVAATKALGGSLGSIDISPYSYVGLWIKPTSALAFGDLYLLLDNTASCTSPLESIAIPACSANAWNFHRLTLVNPAALTSLVSVGVKIQNVPTNNATIKIDNIKAYDPAVILPIKTEDVSLSQELIVPECITSTRDYLEPILGNISVDGPVATEISPYMVRLFKHMLGTCAITGGSAPYTYTCKVSDPPVGMLYEKGFTDIGTYFLSEGLKIDTWKISGTAGKINTLDLTFAGAHSAAGTASFDPAAALPGPQRAFTTFKCDLKESAGGTLLGTIASFEITGNGNLDKSNYVIDSTGERYSLPFGKLLVTGKLTGLFTDLTLYNKALAGTPTKIVVEMWNGDGLGATDGNEKLTITMDELKLKPKAPGVSGPVGIKIDFEFQAYYSSGANATSCMIEVLLPNNTTLY